MAQQNAFAREVSAHSKSVAEELSEKMASERTRGRMIDLGPVIILILLAAAMSIFVEGFFTRNNLVGILSQIASPLVLSMGLTFVILLGSIDLSVEGVMGFTGSLVALLVLNTKNSNDLGILGILISVAVGTSAGLVSGILHVKLRIPSFMATFGMASVMIGFGILSYRGRPASVNDPTFAFLAQGTFLGVPLLTWFSLGIFSAAFVVQRFTAIGKHVYAIGENESVVRSTGINVDRVKILVFVWAAFCSSVAGVFGAIRLNIGQVIIGYGFLFYTITAVVVGGTALAGGRGGVVQSLVGVVIVTLIQDCMVLLGVNAYVQPAIQGLIIIGAVAVTVARGKKLIIK